MKRLFVIAMASAAFVACNGNNTDTADNTTDTTNTTTSMSTTESNNAYSPMEGDVSYRNNSVVVYRNGQWEEAKEDVRLDNGVVVYRNGKVRKDDREIELEDGQIVNKTGDFFDRTGRAIENAWDKTKEGVKDAGQAIGNTAEKAGKKVKNAVDNDKDQ